MTKTLCNKLVIKINVIYVSYAGIWISVPLIDNIQ